MTDTSAAVSPLRRRVIDAMSLRNLSPAIQRSYLHAVAIFSPYSGCSPHAFRIEDVQALQVNLVSTAGFVAGAQPDGVRLRSFDSATLD